VKVETEIDTFSGQW